MTKVIFAPDGGVTKGIYCENASLTALMKPARAAEQDKVNIRKTKIDAPFTGSSDNALTDRRSASVGSNTVGNNSGIVSDGTSTTQNGVSDRIISQGGAGGKFSARRCVFPINDSMK